MRRKREVRVEEKKRPADDEKTENTNVGVTDKRSPSTQYMSLRTVPVTLEANNKRIRVNALLDDASTVSYLSNKIAAELSLEGKEQNTLIGVIGGKTEKINTKKVKCVLRSKNDKTTCHFSALAVQDVVGDMRDNDWQDASKKWTH